MSIFYFSTLKNFLRSVYAVLRAWMSANVDSMRFYEHEKKLKINIYIAMPQFKLITKQTAQRQKRNK